MSDVDLDLDSRWRCTLGPPRTGIVRLLVLRKGAGAHLMPERLRLDPRIGVHGDRWRLGRKRDLDDQLSLMDVRVAQALVANDAERLHEPGDNVLVDLDLGEQALPFGTRLRVGTALVELSGKAHAGCKKFAERMGDEALRWVNAKDNRPYRLRGVYARILEAGEVAVGDLVVPVVG